MELAKGKYYEGLGKFVYRGKWISYDGNNGEYYRFKISNRNIHETFWKNVFRDYTEDEIKKYFCLDRLKSISNNNIC